MPPPTLLEQAQALAARVLLPVPAGVLLGRADAGRAVDEQDAGHGEGGGGRDGLAGVEGAAGEGARWGRGWWGRGGVRVRGFGRAGWAARLGEAGAHCGVVFGGGGSLCFETTWRVVAVETRTGFDCRMVERWWSSSWGELEA